MFPVERVPEKIGAYTVLKYVGRLGLADVYVARMDGPLGFNRVVTLKIVRYALEDDARFAEELAREASICARLNHPAVMRMFDFFEYERKLVLVLEQAEGASLQKLTNFVSRRKQNLADSAILYIATEVGQALAHAHQSVDDAGAPSPVIHRNVSPENIYIAWDGRIKLAGFGLGKILGQTPDSVAGTISGAPGYMAPEQARGERATAKSDVYGLGALLWALYANREPTEIANDRPGSPRALPSIGSIRPDIPREMAAAIDAALEPNPDRRKITCHEISQWTAKLTQPEKGREELKQRMLGLKSARDAIDAPRVAPRPNAKQQRTRRRQQVGAARASLRRSALVGSSFPAPPSSRSARVESRHAPPTGGPRRGEYDENGDAPSGVRLPPPPPLPRPLGGERPLHGLRPASKPASKPASRPAPEPSRPPRGLPDTMRPVPGLHQPPAPPPRRQEVRGPQPPVSRGGRVTVAVARAEEPEVEEAVVEEEFLDRSSEHSVAQLRDIVLGKGIARGPDSVGARSEARPANSRKSDADENRSRERSDAHHALTAVPAAVRPISVIPPGLMRAPSVSHSSSYAQQAPTEMPPSEPAVTPREADPVGHAIRSRQAFEDALRRESSVAEELPKPPAVTKKGRERNPISNAPTAIRENPLPEERRAQLFPQTLEPANETTPTSSEVPSRKASQRRGRGESIDDIQVDGLDDVEVKLESGRRDRPTEVAYRVRGRAEPLEKSRKSLWVTALTAALVVGVGIVVLKKPWATGEGSATASTAQTAEGAPPNGPANASSPTAKAASTEVRTLSATGAPAVAVPPPTNTPSATPPSSAVAASSATPSSSAKATEAPAIDPASLSPDMGLLTVNGPEGYLVYVNGRKVGTTNTANVTPCGQRFLHLALPTSPTLPIWVGKGQTVMTKCLGSTSVTADVEPAPPNTGMNGGAGHRPADGPYNPL